MAKAMKKVADKFPDEVEPQLFYGVAKAATLAHPACKLKNGRLKETCKNELAKIRKSSEKLYAKYPTHSGLIHYVTHYYDEPEVFKAVNQRFVHDMKETKPRNHPASLGIRAAEDYTKVATSSCHGLHMPSHIYLRLGKWNKSLESNLLSIKVNNEDQ